ncbi:MAG: pirin family protein [Bacteroidales bacterium]|jgi:redox-sensitive bicupin YhaK (pirin superfamily)|nr:pirin family protein [Bacteroidales bacterium]
MKTIYHPADSRGFADHGWLKAKHSFSFAEYYDPGRMHFGKLRVLNDDIVAPGKGFGTHPHNNMEIITIPLRGQLEHKDSMGNGSVITPGEVQVMSAGSGIMHSEFNPSNSEEVNLFQIWIFPETQDVDPRYDQREFDPGKYENNILRLVNNETNGDTIFIHQKAAVSLSRLQAGVELTYENNYDGNGTYVMLVNGKVSVGEQTLTHRDALGIWDTDSFAFKAAEDSQLLFIEVPMN